MAYDAGLATRIWDLIGDRPGLVERRMFGGLAFLLNGNMACGVHGDALIVRLAADASSEALAEPGARPFDLTGRPMKGLDPGRPRRPRRGRRPARLGRSRRRVRTPRRCRPSELS